MKFRFRSILSLVTALMISITHIGLTIDNVKAESPPVEENVLHVPWQIQHKDTNMLCLEGCPQYGESAWDDIHPGHHVHGDTYCARASTAMVVNWYLDQVGRGDETLSQDRISFKDGWDTSVFPVDYAFKHGGTGFHELDWALGTTTEQWIEPAFSQIKDWIDKNRPFVAAWGGHMRVIDGYRLTSSGTKFLHIEDPWPLVEPEESSKWMNFDLIPSGWWAFIPLSPADLDPQLIRSDEPSVWTDADGDGIVDFDEQERFKTDWDNPDSDGDGINDKIEIQSYIFGETGEYGPPEWYWDTLRYLHVNYPSDEWQPGYHIYHLTEYMTSQTPIFWATTWYWDEFGGTPENMVEGPWHTNFPLVERVKSRADFDSDGSRAELDLDNDQDGVLDGEEDLNHNGIFEPESGETSIFNPDTTVPTTNIEFGDPSYLDTSLTPSRRFITPVTPIKLLSFDSGPAGFSGVRATMYRYYKLGEAGIDWREYSGAFKIHGPDGRYFIEYYSIDVAGNAEEVHQQMVFIISSDGSPFQISRLANLLNINLSDTGYTSVNFKLKGLNDGITLAELEGNLVSTKWVSSFDLNSYSLSGWYTVIAETDGGKQHLIYSLNNPPVAEAGENYSGYEGDAVMFDASMSYDQDGDTLEFRWDFDNDGLWDTSWSQDATAFHLWNDDYTGVVAVQVSDGEFVDVDFAQVTINNVPPVAQITEITIQKGDSLKMDSTLFIDPAGSYDEYSVSWDFEGLGNPSGFSKDPYEYFLPYVFDNEGTYEVTAIINDGDGGITEALITVNVIEEQQTDNPVKDVDKYRFTLLDPFGDNRDPEDTNDMNMCWAASAANSLTKTGWAVVRPELGFDGLPQWEAYHDFLAAYQDLPSFPSIGFKSYLDWYHDIDADLIDPITNQHPYVVRYTSSLKSRLISLLDEGYGVVLGIYYRVSDQVLGGHAITCWSYSETDLDDPDDSTDDNDVLEIYITDSDDFHTFDYTSQGGTVNDSLYESFVRNNVNIQTVRLALISGDLYLRGYGSGGWTFELLEAIAPNPNTPQTSYLMIDDEIQWDAVISSKWNGYLVEYDNGEGSKKYYYDTKSSKGYLYSVENSLTKSDSSGIPDQYIFSKNSDSFVKFYQQIYQINIDGNIFETFSINDGREFFYLSDSNEENFSLTPATGFSVVQIPATPILDMTKYPVPPLNFTALVQFAEDEVQLPALEPDPSLYVINSAPVAVIDSTTTEYEGNAVNFDASNSIDFDGEIILYEWDFESDDSYDFSSTNPTTSHFWEDDFSGVVTLRVTDDDGLSDTCKTPITIYNSPPEVDAGSDQTVECCSEEVNFSGHFHDQGALDTHTTEWDFGDGTTAIDSLSPAHTYCETGTYKVTLTITDDNGGVGVDTMDVSVVDVTPPFLYAGEDIIVERTSIAGASANIPMPAVSDLCDPSPSISFEGLMDIYPPGNTLITVKATDSSGNSADDTLTVTVVDTTPPEVFINTPSSGDAVQDGMVFRASSADLSGVSAVYFYLREAGNPTGIPIGLEELSAFRTTGTPESGQWELPFDTTILQDGYYVVLAKAIDTYDNEAWSEVVPFSIRNWAVLELLPSSESNKAGRTMPVKFSLRIAEVVDPEQPFVYNEELSIRIYDASDPSDILQVVVFGDSARDYRIDTDGELYLTNFKTDKKPALYIVEIWRLNRDFLVGSFLFETIK